MKRCALFLLLVMITVSCGLTVGDASALTYQDEVDLEFVLNPTISITVSDDLTIANLVPGNYADSNIISVSASSNAVAGYKVYTTVGSSTYASSELKKDGTDNTNKFTSIATSKATLADFSDSNWGYAWCNGTCTTESTWVSGDAGSTTSGYNGLPLYTGTGVKVVDANAPGSSTVSFKIGARAASAQVAGTYNNVINFVAVANPNPEPPKTFDQAFADAGKTKSGNYYVMQDANTTICGDVAAGETTTLIDSRDQSTYGVAKLADGKCWMLDNLALDLTNSSVKAAMYNTTDTKTNATYAQLGYLFNGGGSNQYAATGVVDWTSSIEYSYTQPLVNLASKDVIPSDATSQTGQYKVGGYYNYCAASAGTYCWPDDSSAPSDTQDGVRSIDADICPKGWSIPTGNTNGEYQALYNNASYNTYANYRAALHLPLSGVFYDGSAGRQGSIGGFWSSTRDDSDFMYILRLNTSSVYPSDNDRRSYYGFSVRCRMGD